MDSSAKNLARCVRTSSSLGTTTEVPQITEIRSVDVAPGDDRISRLDAENYVTARHAPAGPLGLVMLEFRYGWLVYGFDCVSVDERHIVIADIWLRRDRRKQGFSRRMVERILQAAQSAGYRTAYTDVPTNARTLKRSLAVAKALGFKFHSATKTSVILRREIGPNVR